MDDTLADAGPALPALQPRGPGHRFLLYGDACSGVPGGRHEATFAAVNRVAARLRPEPEFVIFPGDEVIGLTRDEADLRAQWAYWFDREMAWLDRDRVPLYHTTANHTVYDPMSERVFAETMAHLPRNGPPGQEGLSYWVRRGDLLMVFVNTLWSGLGGEGHVETDWLDRVLGEHRDAAWRLVVGHHPVFPVNGFQGAFQREIGPLHAGAFWQVLARHRVLAYLCSHILAFDVQVHDGVLQVCTAGAGTAHRMPEEAEYLHCVQAALDRDGLRYQVLDVEGRVREALAWPFALPEATEWRRLDPGGPTQDPDGDGIAGPVPATLRAWRFAGTAAPSGTAAPQTLLCGWGDGPAMPRLWVGLCGPDQRLTVMLGGAPGRSPHSWFGPALPAGERFDLTLVLHGGMGPGGLLLRHGSDGAWSSLDGRSAHGPERIGPVARWTIGHEGRGGGDDRPFLGAGLAVHVTAAVPA